LSAEISAERMSDGVHSRCDERTWPSEKSDAGRGVTASAAMPKATLALRARAFTVPCSAIARRTNLAITLVSS
jgi:hypothetical protein